MSHNADYATIRRIVKLNRRSIKMTNDITNVIEKAEIIDAISKNGTKYNYIKLTLINKGEVRINVFGDSKFMWNNAIELLNEGK